MLSQDDAEVNLYFVLPSRFQTKEECEPVMLNVFQECEKETLAPQWLTETQCLALRPDKFNVFVFQRFEGEAFDHLSQFKCVLVGPQCLITIFKERSQLPHLPRPFFTMAMNGLIVAASGFGPEGKERLRKKIELMAGQYVAQLRGGTTHLIVNSVQSEKYIKAVTSSIPVMTEKWLDAVYSESLEGYVKATDPKFEKFKCPPFQGLHMSTSKLSSADKKKVVQLIQSNGGIYSGSFTNRMNMLVVSKPDGEKFKHARNWDIVCVSPRWIYDCVQQGHSLPLEKYEIKGKCTSSPNSKLREELDFSTISNIAMPECSRVDETAISDITTATISDFSTTSFFKTPRQPRNGSSSESVFVKPQAPPVPSSPKRAAPSDASSRRNLTPKKSPSPAQFKHLLDELDLSKTKQAGQFLDGCKVFLYGFNSEHEEKLRRVLKGSGASRFTELSDSVTHILLGDVFDKAFSKQLKEFPYRPHIVTLQWLIQSITLRGAANEEHYSFAEAEAENAAAETPSPLSKKGLALLQRGDESPGAVRAYESRTVDSAKLSSKKSSRLLKELRESDPEVEDLTAFYRQESATSMPAPPPRPRPNNRPDGTPSDNRTGSVLPDSRSEGALPDGRSDIANPDDSKDCSTVCSQDYVQVFAGLKFVIVGLKEEIAGEISKLIVLNGGQVVPRTFKGVPDYAVVPLTGTSVSAAGEIVNPYWVDDCIYFNKIVAVEYFHQPISVPSRKAPLRDCVVGLSGYSRKERLFLMDLTTLLGGIPQEVFARKDNPEKNAKASTHLICNAAEGSKFSAAIKWNLPAVSNLWLLECCKSGRRCSVRPFLIDPKQEIVENIPPEGEDNAEAEAVENGGNSKDPITPLKPLALQRVAGEAAALSPFHVSTPDTPYGISENPSPGERKRLKKWLDRFPDYPVAPEPPKRRLSTPLSEIRKQIWDKMGIHTPKAPDEIKSGCKRTSEDCEETLPESAKRARLDEVVENRQGVDTPGGSEKSCVPKNLFPENISRAEGQLEEAKKLLEMPLPTSGIGSVGSSTSNTSPVKEKTVPRVPKEVSQPYEINWEDPLTMAEAKKDPHYEERRSTVPIASSSKRMSGETESSSKRKSADTESSSKRKSADTESSSKRKSVETESSSKRKSVETEEDIPKTKAPVGTRSGEDASEPSNEAQLPKIRIFMLSSIDDREREHYASMVSKLGGKILAGMNFEKRMTHLVVDKPARNEKLLASIASGKWVLHSSYIQDSFKAGKFLKEEDYEWGAPQHQKLMALLRPGSYDVLLAKAAYRWRRKLSGTGSGAFEGFRAVVGAPPNKIESFRRLIEAGGGIVLKPSELDKATHYLRDNVNSADKLNNPTNVPEYRLLHLSDFLVKVPSEES